MFQLSFFPYQTPPLTPSSSADTPLSSLKSMGSPAAAAVGTATTAGCLPLMPAAAKVTGNKLLAEATAGPSMLGWNPIVTGTSPN